jgi:hypothetical protein
MAKTTSKRYSAAAARKLIEKYLRAKDAGKAAYGEADKCLTSLLEKLPVGAEIDLPGGRVARLVDQFANGKNKVFKPCGVERLTIVVSHSKD